MTQEEFQIIKKKINQAELDSATCKGKIEAIEESWKQEYGFNTLEEAEQKLNEINQDIQEKTDMRNKLMDKLEKSFDWDSI